MLTPEGAALVLQIAAGLSDDSLRGSLRVSDGSQAATAPLTAAPVVRDGAVVLESTFPENAANFEWRIIEVLSERGVVVDREQGDNGRKAAGAIWTLDASIELTGDSGA